MRTGILYSSKPRGTCHMYPSQKEMNEAFAYVYTSNTSDKFLEKGRGKDIIISNPLLSYCTFRHVDF